MVKGKVFAVNEKPATDNNEKNICSMKRLTRFLTPTKAGIILFMRIGRIELPSQSWQVPQNTEQERQYFASILRIIMRVRGVEPRFSP